MDLASSISFLSAHVTLHNTGKSSRISPLRFLRVGFRLPDNVAICFYRLTMLKKKQLQGCAHPL